MTSVSAAFHVGIYAGLTDTTTALCQRLCHHRTPHHHCTPLFHHKQAREIREGGNIVYVDGATVRAVKAGRVLIVGGIEKAECGIMPVCSDPALSFVHN